MYRQSEKNLLNINTSSTCPDNMVNFGLLTAEICWRVWSTTANFNGFRVLAALLHDTLVVGATYIRQGGHHVGHWPSFLVWSVLTLDCKWAAFYNSVIPCLSLVTYLNIGTISFSGSQLMQELFCSTETIEVF